MKTVNYAFREELNKMLGGFSHNYCYQCGACVADCPAHRFKDEFNPRTIMLQAIYGLEDDLIGPDSLIWNCTNCYNCYERCPQNVNPIEVIITLKNMAEQKEKSPSVLKNIKNRVQNTGLTVTETELVKKRRLEMKLPEFKVDCVEELQTLLE